MEDVERALATLAGMSEYYSGRTEAITADGSEKLMARSGPEQGTYTPGGYVPKTSTDGESLGFSFFPLVDEFELDMHIFFDVNVHEEINKADEGSEIANTSQDTIREIEPIEETEDFSEAQEERETTRAWKSRTPDTPDIQTRSSTSADSFSTRPESDAVSLIAVGASTKKKSPQQKRLTYQDTRNELMMNTRNELMKNIDGSTITKRKYHEMELADMRVPRVTRSATRWTYQG